VFNSDSDGEGTPDNRTGLDTIQVFLQYDITKVGLTGGSVSRLSALSGNPFGTSWTGRTTSTYNGLNYAEGALIPSSNVDQFGWTKIMQVYLTVGAPGTTTTVSLLPNVTTTHDAFQGNSIVIAEGNGEGKYPAIQGAVTFIPEPMTMALLGLGALFLRRRK
jgi:hypothetical protein